MAGKEVLICQPHKIIKIMEKYLDTTYLPEERKVFYQEFMNKVMNPDKSFDPETFDPMKNTPEYEIGRRARVLPSGELPTFGLKPKQLMVGQMIGMFESKQDLYLMFAHKCNSLQEEVDTLEKRILELENK